MFMEVEMPNVLKEELLRRRNLDYDRARWMGRTRYGDQGDYMDEYDAGYEPSWYYYEEDWMIPGPFTGVGPVGYHRREPHVPP